MCIAYLALATDPQWPLFIAANRDEFHARPTRAAAPWPHQPTTYGGVDLQAGGTWFAVNQTGRFALLTNHRNLLLPQPVSPLSRGLLCKDFVEQTISPAAYLQQVAQQGQHYAGFNLIVGQWQSDQQQFECLYYSNHLQQPPVALAPGHYVLSNGFLNTPWPKSERLRQQLTGLLHTSSPTETDKIYDILRDSVAAPSHLLPQTGLSLEREQLLSSPFIISPDYGTRSSSVWAVAQHGHSILHECSYNSRGIETERHSWPIPLAIA
ncbi:NRDE family protein [Paenalcaligenes hominis]|uniref:NRDE family protein n=1 Tax=Paenalcaligenes hominis TaxID=643674 RepID=UPI003526BB71